MDYNIRFKLQTHQKATFIHKEQKQIENRQNTNVMKEMITILVFQTKMNSLREIKQTIQSISKFMVTMNNKTNKLTKNLLELNKNNSIYQNLKLLILNIKNNFQIKTLNQIQVI